MKKVIDGLLYNTEESEKITTYSNNKGRSDFYFVREHLYQTENGRYFLHCEGGAATTYSKSVGNASTGSQTIKPLEESDVIDWLEKHNKVRVLEDRFQDHLQKA